MDKNPDITNFAVSLIIKAALIAARFSGRVRKRSLKCLAAMEVDAKDKEIISLKDKVYQLEIQVSILQKRVQKRQKKPERPKRDSKTVPCQIEQHLFRETRITGYRLKAVA